MEDRERRLLGLLQRVWTYAITTKSDYAREYADEIAQGASAGLLTTAVTYPPTAWACDRDPDQFAYGRLWKITLEGLAYLQRNEHMIAAEEIDKYTREYILGGDTEGEPTHAE